ncbi:CLaudin-like in Caenorhabditis [Caenorhabditis elegans]|uniref:CLaudin-like in Caenorhabditis n=1 Tax=Caenorhabditis elegans TaxID=6239 RepID=O45852_CAEEL|nr:Uncharacterized protein CELE_T27C5.8 [Caenorhabditis elegans]CAB04869.2 Uncharacterized protein CELE_T27C5.8 [Caenorhabditis elegans]|eukprot:NP_507407.2 Uncharacterized protein CELE_T27C5.8 [Caenorhabditis elegans]
MATAKRLFFTVVTIDAMTCNFFGVLSIAWVTDWSGSIGLFPLWVVTIGWYVAASLVMEVSLLCTVLVLIQLIVTSNTIRRNGYSPTQRGKFISIAVLSLFITVLTVVGVTLIGVNLPHMNRKYNDNATLGYSAWISVAGAVFYLVVAGLSISYACVECSSTKSHEPSSII